MDSREWLVSMFIPSKKKRSNEASSSTSNRKKRRGSQDDPELKQMMEYAKQLKETRLLSSFDDAFHLSFEIVHEIILIIRSHRLPTRKEFSKWDVYAKAFYHKTLACFENKPPLTYESLKEKIEHMECSQPLTEEILSEEKEHMECSQPLTKEILSEEKEHMECSQPLTKEILSEEEDSLVDDKGMNELFPPFQFGSYSSGTKPLRIPYHLYLLVKEAVDIMNRSEWHCNTVDQKDLTMVEKKIQFFCDYFHSHLPDGWKYNRAEASNVVARYDPTHEPRYDMTGYIPIPISICDQFADEFEYDAVTELSRQNMIVIMGIIRSRETPAICKMWAGEILFYCKICSCFGIDYQRLEAASEDDVCLMNVVRKG